MIFSSKLLEPIYSNIIQINSENVCDLPKTDQSSTTISLNQLWEQMLCSMQTRMKKSVFYIFYASVERLYRRKTVLVKAFYFHFTVHYHKV